MIAELKYALLSEKKLTLVAKLVQWKTVKEALIFLELLPKKWALVLYKLIKSAYHNALNKDNNIKVDDLIVKHIHVWRWPKLKRYRFASRSRVHPYIKHRSFVRVVLVQK